MKKILAFSGSNSSKSINQQLVQIAASMVEGHEVEVIDLRYYDAPLYGIDLENKEGIPPSILKLKSKIQSADGMIIATPEHNGSMPAFLKNTIDWLSRINQKVFDDKPVLFIATSPGGRGGKSALEHLVSIMPYRGAKVVGSFSLPSFNENVINGVLEAKNSTMLQAEVDKLVLAVQ